MRSKWIYFLLKYGHRIIKIKWQEVGLFAFWTFLLFVTGF